MEFDVFIRTIHKIIGTESLSIVPGILAQQLTQPCGS